MVAAYDLILKAMPFVETRLFYHPNGETQNSLFEKSREAYRDAGIPVVQTEGLFKHSTYAPLNMGEAYGCLKIASPSIRISATDIVIFKSIPNDLSRVAGIISEIPQTPLSHVNLKAKQNGIPNVYIRDAASLPDIAPFLGKNVHLVLTADGYSIRSATREEVNAFFEATRPAKVRQPVRDLTATSIAALADIGYSDAKAFGSKSANVAELLDMLPEGMVPEGYAIPFYFYNDFMRHNGFYDLAANLFSDETFKTNAVIRERRLKSFRKQMRDGEVFPAMRTALGEVQAKFPATTRIRCRSSSNVEDLMARGCTILKRINRTRDISARPSSKFGRVTGRFARLKSAPFIGSTIRGPRWECCVIQVFLMNKRMAWP